MVLRHVDLKKYKSYLPTAFDESLTLLQKMNKLIEFLNFVVDTYNGLELSVVKHLEEQDLQIEEVERLVAQLQTEMTEFKEDILNDYLPENIEVILDDWFLNGKLAEIINNDVFDMKVDKTTFEPFELSTNQQLAQITENIVYIDDFERLEGELDDTGRLQRAIDSFTGNIAGAIAINGDIHISSQVNCYKTGLRLIGVNNRISRIISNYGGISLFIKPLLNGNPYTSVSYCKFFTDNVAIVGEGLASETGVGVHMQWIYASSHNNLYVTGFKRGIVLKGAHLNTFYNLYLGDKDSTVATEEIFNRGVGLSANGELDEAGETTSNNNHIIGGWINNSSLDFRNMQGTIVELVDIEPASNTIYTGDESIFCRNRFERFDIYAVASDKYPKFTWFDVGNNCKFYDNEIHQSGAHQNEVYPFFRVRGDGNEIEFPKSMWYANGNLVLEQNAKNNVFTFKNPYSDYEKTLFNDYYKLEKTSVTMNNHSNTFIYHDYTNGSKVTTNDSFFSGTGLFTSYQSKNTDLRGDNYISQGITRGDVDIPLPLGRTNPLHFVKLTTNLDGSVHRLLLNNSPLVSQTVEKSGVYTFVATVFIPTGIRGDVKVGPSLGHGMSVYPRDKWVVVRVRGYFNVGDLIVPTVNIVDGVTNGDTVYIGEMNVCKGNTAIFFENDGFTPVSIMR